MALAIERILADEHGLQDLGHQLRIVGCGPACRAEEGMAEQALVGLDRDEPEVALAGEAARVPSVLGCRDAVPGKNRDGDVGDLHGSHLSRTCLCRHR